MHTIIATARKDAGYSQAEVANMLHLSLRAFKYLESGEREVTPLQALKLSRVLNQPALTFVYCRKHCPIGQAFCYDLLNNVDLSPMAILAKYRQEAKEAQVALDKLSDLLLNKRSAQDCTPSEMAEIKRWAHPLLDLEHVIETLKLQLWNFIDVGEMVKEHNQKCMDKQYFSTQKPAVKAG